MSRSGLCPWPIFHTWVTMVRMKWWSLYYSTYGFYIHQTYTYCSSWHDLLTPRGVLRPWLIFHAWVSIVRKKWLSLYYSTYWCYIHWIYTEFTPTVHLDMIYWRHVVICVLDLYFTLEWALLGMKLLSLYYSTYGCYIPWIYTNCSSWHHLLTPRGDLCPWPAFHASVTKTKNGNSGAPVMVPVTIMSSFSS